MTTHLIFIIPSARLIRDVDFYEGDYVELFTKHIMQFKCWLNDTDALYVKDFGNHCFSIGDHTVRGVGMIVGVGKDASARAASCRL